MPSYKEWMVKEECKNDGEINLLSISGKLYGRIIIERVKKITVCSMSEGEAEER